MAVRHITRADLDQLASVIDTALGLPEGTHSINVAYGAPRLFRDGQTVEVSPRLPNRQLDLWMRAYVAGIWAGRAQSRP